MSISFGHTTGEIVNSPGAGTHIRTYSMTINSSSIGIAVMVTGGRIGTPDGVAGVDVGGVSYTDSVDITYARGRAMIFAIEDISARANDIVTVDLVSGPTRYNIFVAVFQGSGSMELDAIDKDSSTSATPLLNMDPGGESAIGLVCGANEFSMTNLSGQTGLWSDDFFGVLRSVGSYRSFSTATNMGYTAGTGFACSAMAFIEVPASPTPPGYEDPFFPEDPTIPQC